MSLDRFLSRTFDAQRFNCLHFAREVYLDLTGKDIHEKLNDLFVSVDLARERFDENHLRTFESIPEPTSPCLVYFARQTGLAHVGVYKDGKVIHLFEDGVRCQRLENLKMFFPVVRYFRCS